MQEATYSMTAKQVVFSAIRKIGIGVMLVLLSGCWAPSIKPSAAEISKLRVVLVVPVESPPLEVIPDLLEQHDPAYRHYQNMALGFPLPRKRYRTPGGIDIAGLMAMDDREVVISENEAALKMTLVAQAQPDWTPARAAALQAMSQLASLRIKGELYRDYYPLPMTNAERDAHLHHWRNAIMQWYGQERTPVDYGRQGQFDAVLELGIGRYRIFEGQTALEIMMKLIDPISGRVIARARADNFRVSDSALATLDRDGEAFKRLINAQASPLLAETLAQIGWR